MRDVVDNERLISLHYLDGKSRNWDSVWWRLAFDTQMTWVLALCAILIYRRDNLLSCSFFIVNCIDGLIEFHWSTCVRTSSWWVQRMNISSTYLSHHDGFCDVDPNLISAKYSMNTSANTGDKQDPIASSPSYLFMLEVMTKS